MTEAINGKDRILMFRVKGDRKAAAKLSLQTEHTWKYERKTESTKTKDGAVVSDGGLEVTLEIKGISSRDELNVMLANSVIQGQQIEIWDIDLAGQKQGKKYPAKYAIGQLSSWEVPANVEELSEISTEASIIGVPVDGYATLTDEQAAAVQYVFADTAAIS